MKHKHFETALLVHFSGTGGVRRIADAFDRELRLRGLLVKRHSLDRRELRSLARSCPGTVAGADVIILVFAVHAFDAPEPVFEWIGILPPGNGKPVAVVSVSGGGEKSLNRACRVRAIQALEKCGYDTTFETMMVMPSNWVTPTPDEIAIRLIRLLPQKVHGHVADILAERRVRVKISFMTRMVARFISRMEKYGTGRFGRGLRVSDACTGCGWCAKSCPQENIAMKDGQPRFGKECIMCFRCIYGCPAKSIHATRAKFMVLGGGYDLKALEERMSHTKLSPLPAKPPGYLWSGVWDYLSDLGKRDS